jgi:hypothetical protein
MNLDIENRILAILARWGVPRHTFDVAFLRWGEIIVKAGGQTVKILSTGEIHFRDKHLCNVPESAICHLVAGIILALHRDDVPRLGTYPTDNHSPEFYE